MSNNRYLAETPLLNFSHKAIADLIDSRGWAELERYEKIGASYHFVKDEIAFGYNESDDIPASQVLSVRVRTMQHESAPPHGAVTTAGCSLPCTCLSTG